MKEAVMKRERGTPRNWVKRALVICALMLPVSALLGLGIFVGVHGAFASAACSPTGLGTTTAALVNPSAVVSGDVTATGCTFGVYFGPGKRGSVEEATVHGASGSGVFNNGGHASVLRSTLHTIRVGVTFQGGASGEISGNRISQYTRSGIVVKEDGTSALIFDNRITGPGPSNLIQYGLQINSGAKAVVIGNTVTGNSYTGPDSAGGGLLLTGGPFFHGASYTSDVSIIGNTFADNDVGVWINNLGGTPDSPAIPSQPTNVNVIHNTITNNHATPPNQFDGLGIGCPGYQTGIEDIGNNDKLINNTIGGIGYPPVLNACQSAINADPAFTKIFATRLSSSHRLTPDD